MCKTSFCTFVLHCLQRTISEILCLRKKNRHKTLFISVLRRGSGYQQKELFFIPFHIICSTECFEKLLIWLLCTYFVMLENVFLTFTLFKTMRNEIWTIKILFLLAPNARKRSWKTPFSASRISKTNFLKWQAGDKNCWWDKAKKHEKARRTRSYNYFSFCLDAKNYAKGKNNKKLGHFSLHEHSKPDIADPGSLQNWLFCDLAYQCKSSCLKQWRFDTACTGCHSYFFCFSGCNHGMICEAE